MPGRRDSGLASPQVKDARPYIWPCSTRSFADGKVDHDLLLQVISAAMRFVVVRMLRHGLDAVTRKRRARRKADSKAQ